MKGYIGNKQVNDFIMFDSMFSDAFLPNFNTKSLSKLIGKNVKPETIWVQVNSKNNL